ncbi:MAG: hypothetical protein GX947_04835, partial [Tissierellia bacterium]|nr:hypothetical protein [Tissierellia bacterium]
KLDDKNPRFILPKTGDSQENIRKYLLEQENALVLTRNIVEYGGLMPGERIVVTKENGDYIVLEGNRRTCACQILVDRSLIPFNLIDRIPPSSETLIRAISEVEIDIIPSREEARRFLATRHIERAKGWSTIAKMRFCYEDYELGHSVSTINDRTGLSVPSINKYIRNYKILMRGLEGTWSPEERDKLFILDIKPDKLVRLFELSDTKKFLQLYFDDQYTLNSNLISKDDIDEIIHIWTRKAFIDDEINTRTLFGKFTPDGGSIGACKFIENILKKYYPCNSNESCTTEGVSTSEDTSTLGTTSTSEDAPTPETTSTSEGAPTPETTLTPEDAPTSGSTSSSIPKLSRFFSGLNLKNVRETEQNGKGVIAVCNELDKISKSQTFINKYPICTVFIIRALIEQSIKYYAKKNGYWTDIMKNYQAKGKSYGEPQLSFIINQFKANKTWIPDKNIQRLFNVVFKNNVQVEKFNLVVHSPELYTLSPDTLKSIPDEGLLAISNYFLS